LRWVDLVRKFRLWVARNFTAQPKALQNKLVREAVEGMSLEIEDLKLRQGFIRQKLDNLKYEIKANDSKLDHFANHTKKSFIDAYKNLNERLKEIEKNHATKNKK